MFTFIVAVIATLFGAGLMWVVQSRHKSERTAEALEKYSSGQQNSEQFAVNEPTGNLPIQNWRVSSETGAALIEIATVDEQLAINQKQGASQPQPSSDESVSEEALAQLSALLSQAPEFAKNAATVSRRCYRLTFSPEINRALRKGIAEFVPAGKAKWAIARDMTTKKFIGNGTIVPSANTLAIGTLAFSALSTLSAQKHLANIAQSLRQIDKRLDAIQNWQETEELGSVMGNMKYLLNKATSLQSGTLTSVDIQSLNSAVERIECESLQTLTASRLRHQSLMQRLADKPKQGHSEAGYQDLLSRYKGSLEACVNALLARLVAARLQLSLPVNPNSPRDRIQDTAEHIRELEHGYDVFCAAISPWIPDPALTSMPWDRDPFRKRMEALKTETLASAQNMVQQAQTAFQEAQRQTEGMHDSDAEPLSLLVQVDAAGNVVNAREIPA